MRAIGLTEFGGPDVLGVVELPTPEPGPDEVRIRVHAATVNPTDTLFRDGAQRARLAERQPPFRPGMDAAGVVEAVGSDVTRLREGDRVAALIVPAGPNGGAYAEQVVVPAAAVVVLPDSIDFVPGSTLLMNGLTARLAIDALGLEGSDPLAVTGAAGALGGYVIQLAKADGYRVIADSQPSDEELLTSLGADELVERGAEAAGAIRREFLDGVPGLVDGAVQGLDVLSAVAPGGTMAVVRGWSDPEPTEVRIAQIMVGHHQTETAQLERLVQQAADGVLTLRVAEVIPAARAADAHRKLEAGGVRGRLVLDFSQPLA